MRATLLAPAAAPLDGPTDRLEQRIAGLMTKLSLISLTVEVEQHAAGWV